MASEASTANSNQIQRHQSEPTMENEVRKSCSCKKLRCLQIYCECFSAGVYCLGCDCCECLNKPTNEEYVTETRKKIQSRSPRAFTPKLNGPRCECKRSSCQKERCGCYRIGVGCFVKCKCEDCKNDYGRKMAPAQKEPDDQSRECSCKNSKCQKDFCGCYKICIGCSVRCKCEDCKNDYGRKNVSAPSSSSKRNRTV